MLERTCRKARRESALPVFLEAEDSEDIQSGNGHLPHLAYVFGFSVLFSGYSVGKPHAEQATTSAIWLRRTVSDRRQLELPVNDN
jgi:hypothetical protein